MQNKLFLFHRFHSVVLSALFLSAIPYSAHAEEWTNRVWNPKPMADDVIIDLPCNGKMALRRVQAVLINPSSPTASLSDSPVMMGATEGERAYMEYRREEHISGSLANDKGAFFLIGKYEVSHAQYMAVMANDNSQCPTRFNPPDAIPQTSLSWYDAVEFTRRLNSWLYNNDPEQLKKIGAPNGFVRLPTEVEWEFATRGGLTVNDAERANNRFFSTGSIDDYGWYNGSQSSGGKLKPIGQKKPNPLGLFDVYGNAEEIMLEPFRLTRIDRLHGGVGGFVVRGGSFLDGAETLTSSRRDEFPFFSSEAGGEMKRRTAGIRIVVSTASITNLASVNKLETAFEDLSHQVEGPATAQPSVRLQEIEEQVEGPLRVEISTLRARLEAEFTRRNDVEARSLRRALFNVGLSARELHLAARALDNYDANIKDQNFPADLKKRTENMMKKERSNFDMFATIYTEAIAQIANDQGTHVTEQGLNLKHELKEQGRDSLISYVDEAIGQINAYKTGKATQTKKIISNLIGPHNWLQ